MGRVWEVGMKSRRNVESKDLVERELKWICLCQVGINML